MWARRGAPARIPTTEAALDEGAETVGATASHRASASSSADGGKRKGNKKLGAVAAAAAGGGREAGKRRSAHDSSDESDGFPPEEAHFGVVRRDTFERKPAFAPLAEEIRLFQRGSYAKALEV